MITFASFFNLSTNSSTVSTITPASLSGGKETFKVEILGVISIPKSATGITSRGLDFAFIMFGKDAYLGSLSLKSVVTIAGRFTDTVCKPPSTSLVTVALPSEIESSEAKVA